MSGDCEQRDMLTLLTYTFNRIFFLRLVFSRMLKLWSYAGMNLIVEKRERELKI